MSLKVVIISHELTVDIFGQRTYKTISLPKLNQHQNKHHWQDKFQQLIWFDYISHHSRFCAPADSQSKGRACKSWKQKESKRPLEVEKWKKFVQPTRFGNESALSSQACRILAFIKFQLGKKHIHVEEEMSMRAQWWCVGL